jgi:hypothetical protein
MLVEYLYRINNRSSHQPVELERILDYMTNLNNKKNIEHQLYTKTKFYREWLSNNPNATPDEISDEKQKTFIAVNFASTFQPYKEFVYDENGNVIIDKKGKPKHKGTCQASETEKLSGILVLDFDKLENIEAIRQKLVNDINTFIVFPSPSGKGLKVLVKHNLCDVTKWRHLFEEVRDYYLKRTEVPDKSLDISGSDVSRMCYIPYVKKEELYRKNDSWVWTYRGDFEKQQQKAHNDCGENNEIQYSQTEITEELYMDCFYVSVYLAANSINIAESYGDWVSYGYSLCALNGSGRKIFHNISSVSDKYNSDECDEKYDYMLDNFDSERTNINHYLTNAKKAIADYVIQAFIPTIRNNV